MSVSSRHAIDTLPIKVYCRDGSHITVKLGPLATFSDLHRALVMKVRGMKEQMVLKDSDPLLRYFALYTVTSEHFIERLAKPSDSVWAAKETFKLPSDHFEFARLVARSPALLPPPPLIGFHPASVKFSREAVLSDDESSTKIRSSASSQAINSSQKRFNSPRPNTAVGSTLSPTRRAKSDVDSLGKIKLERLGLTSGAEDGESEDDPVFSPNTSPRHATGPVSSPHTSPRRARRMSIGGPTNTGSASHSANFHHSHSSQCTPNFLTPMTAPVKLDSTLLWADFLEATHLVATCPLFKPKEHTDVIELAALHFYIFSLQSPPTESSSRKERAKSSGGGRDPVERDTSQLSVHMEESPALSKTYRKALHKNVGAFFPPRLMTSTLKGNVLEDAIWSSYGDYVPKKYTVEDAMQEYTRIFNRWRYSGVRLFFEVKREVVALLTPKSAILAVNEDGVAVLKKDKENEMVASYPYTNLASWTVNGNCLVLEVLTDDATVAGPSGVTLSDALSSSASVPHGVAAVSTTSQSTSSSSSTLLQFPTSVLSTLAKSQPFVSSSNAPSVSQVTFFTYQSETISAIIQFYVDRLTSVVFDRSETLKAQPSPRIFLSTDVGIPGTPSGPGEHQITAESLVPALHELNQERTIPSPHSTFSWQGSDSVVYSSTSDSDRESSNPNLSHSISTDALSTGSGKRMISKQPPPAQAKEQASSLTPSSPSSPNLGRRRSPSIPKAQWDSRIESIRIADSALNSGDEGSQVSEDGPRRPSSRRRPATHRLASSKYSDNEARGSESDRERLATSQGMTTDGSESEFQMHSRSDSPMPIIDHDMGPSSSLSDTTSSVTYS